MTAETVRIILELDPDADPIAGSVSCQGAPATPFSGWLAFTRAIEQLTARARALQPAPDASTGAPADHLCREADLP